MVTGIEKVLLQRLKAASQGHRKINYFVCKQMHFQVEQVGKGRRLYFDSYDPRPACIFQEKVTADLTGQELHGLLLPGIGEANAVGISVMKDDLTKSIGNDLLLLWGGVIVFNDPVTFYDLFQIG